MATYHDACLLIQHRDSNCLHTAFQADAIQIEPSRLENLNTFFIQSRGLISFIWLVLGEIVFTISSRVTDHYSTPNKGGVKICYTSFQTILDTLFYVFHSPWSKIQRTTDYFHQIPNLSLIAQDSSRSLLYPKAGALTAYPSSVYFLYKTKSLFRGICTRGLFFVN